MRKVVVLMHISLDAYAASTDGDLEWTFAGMNEEVAEFGSKLFREVDTAVYGRNTYEGMYGYWASVPENPESTPGEVQHAEWVNQIPKVVFSTTLNETEWNNTKLVKENVAEEVAALKELPGKSIMVFGSPGLVHSFAELDLVDEYLIYVHPVVLGEGVPLFKDVKERLPLKLVASEVFSNGVVHLCYEVARGKE